MNMMDILIKQLGLDPEKIKGQIETAVKTVNQFDDKLNKIISLLEKNHAKNIQENLPLTILLSPLSNGEKTDV